MNVGSSLDRNSKSFDGCNFALTENPHMKRAARWNHDREWSSPRGLYPMRARQ